MLTLVFIILYSIQNTISQTPAPTVTNTGWVLPPTPKMAEGNYKMAGIGYYQDTVFMFGGFSGGWRLMQYHLNNQTFTDDELYLRYIIGGQSLLYGDAQTWTQIDNKLYISGDRYGFIHYFELDTKQFIPSFVIATTAEYFGYDACLAGKYDTLYYIGGYDQSGTQGNKYYNTLKILENISNISNPFQANWDIGPAMNEPRSQSACIVSSNDKLYVIGGLKAASDLSATIEYIPIDNIYNETWQYTVDQLTTGWNYPRAVIYNDLIFVIGGGDTLGNGFDMVHIIDTITDKVTVSNYRMVTGEYGNAPILINDVIYSFGGKTKSSAASDSIQYWSVSTANPTATPTDSTHAPSSYPTLGPTVPTSNPSATPTDLTDAPSSDPTANPAGPTSYPSELPTNAPFGEVVDNADEHHLVFGMVVVLFVVLLQII